MHKGSVEDAKKPAITKSAIDKLSGTLNIKKKRGTEDKSNKYDPESYQGLYVFL